MTRSSFLGSSDTRSLRRGLLIASVSLLTGIVLNATLLSPPPSTREQRQPAVPAHRMGGATLPPASAEPEMPTPAPGPTRVESGVPAGFARTPEGAVAAAASFVCTGQVLLDMDPLAAEEAVRQMASATAADRQVAEALAALRSVRSTLASGMGPTIYRQAAVAWKVLSFSPAQAQVAIWNVGVLARDGIAPPQAGWAVSTFDLLWERGDWKVLDERITPGPAPILDDSAAPATAAQLIASLRGFTDFRGTR